MPGQRQGVARLFSVGRAEGATMGPGLSTSPVAASPSYQRW
jgi:hypothetical protein